MKAQGRNLALYIFLLQIIYARSLFRPNPSSAALQNQICSWIRLNNHGFKIIDKSICFLGTINDKRKPHKYYSKKLNVEEVTLQARQKKYSKRYQSFLSFLLSSRSSPSRTQLSMLPDRNEGYDGDEDRNLQGYNGYGNPSDDMGFAIPPDIKGPTSLSGSNEIYKMKSVDVRRQEEERKLQEKVQELKECYLLEESELEDQLANGNSSPVVLGYQEDAKDPTKHPELIVNMTRPLGISIEETLDKRTQETKAVWLAEVDNPSAIKQGLSVGDVIIAVSFMFDDSFLVNVEGKSMDEMESYISCRQLPYTYIRVRKGHTYHVEAMEEEEKQMSKTPDQIEEENEQSQLKWYDLRKEVFADYYPVDLSCIDSVRYDADPDYRPGDFSPSPDDTRDRDGPIILPPEEIEKDEQEWD